MPTRPYRNRELHDHLARTRGACLERGALDQSTPAGMRPAQAMCVVCGRVTARRDDDGLPWCGGDPITLDQYHAERGESPP